MEPIADIYLAALVAVQKTKWSHHCYSINRRIVETGGYTERRVTRHRLVEGGLSNMGGMEERRSLNKKTY